MKTGGKNKSVAFITLFSVCIVLDNFQCGIHYWCIKKNICMCHICVSASVQHSNSVEQSPAIMTSQISSKKCILKNEKNPTDQEKHIFSWNNTINVLTGRCYISLLDFAQRLKRQLPGVTCLCLQISSQNPSHYTNTVMTGCYSEEEANC